MSIRTKLLLIIIGPLVFCSAIIGGVAYWQNNQKLIAHANTDIKNTINYNFQLINFYLDRAQSSLSNLASDPLIITALETKDPIKLTAVSNKLTVVNENVSVIEGIGLHEIDGSKCINIAADAKSISIVGRDFSDRDYCQGIIKTKSAYLSSAFISAATGRIVLGMAVPVKNTQGEMIGYILGTVGLAELRSYLWDLQTNTKVEILDRYNIMFLTTEKLLATLDSLPSQEKSEVLEIQKRLAVGTKEGYFQNEGDFVGYKSTDSLTVIFEEPTASLFAFIRTLNFTILAALILAIILISIIVTFFVRKIAERISRLSKITQQIAGGQFNIKLEAKDLEAKDETAVLARAFNEMAAKLSGVYKDLEIKVKQRTKEAEEKNKKLEEADIELKKSLATSERINKMMVGRELQMKSLKQEIIELKKKLEK